MKPHRPLRRSAARAVLALAVTVAAVGLAPAAPAGAAVTATAVEGGVPTVYTNTAGDTWSTTWADDDNLYATSDDTYGIDQACPVDDINLAIHKFTGNDPRSLTGTTINCMTAYANKTSPPTHPDGLKWKVGGMTSISGTLYLTIMRDNYFNPAYGNRQDSQNATIIKSTDHGLTWSGSEQNSYDNPMFPGRSFAKPVFVEYGKDGAATVDGADTYVYAMSNNGFWNNGDSIVLGRVPRSKIGALNAADWQFYGTGGTWVSNPSQATPVITDTGHLGQAQVTYVPGLGQYVLAAWYYPNCCGETNRTVWNFYRAQHPWGPWTKITDREWKPTGYYNPTILSKFQSSDGSQVWAVTAGDYGTPDYSKHGQTGFNGYYSFTTVPLRFGDFSRPLINDTDPSVTYSPSGWVADSGRGKGDYQDDVHYTQTQGAWAQFSFTGTGVQVFSEAYRDEGNVQISVDGGTPVTVSGYSDQRVGRVLLWSTEGLTAGSHTVRLTNASTSYLLADAIRPLGPASVTNLLGDPGFEQGGAWSTYGAAGRVQNSAHTGSWSSVGTAANNGSWQDVTVQPNTKYTLSGYGEKDATLSRIFLFVNNYGGSEIDADFTGTTYANASLTFTTGPSTTRVTVGYWANGGSGSGHVDDLSLTVG